MNPELLFQLAHERLLDLDRARLRTVSLSDDEHVSRRAHAPLRPVGVAFIRLGLWMAGSVQTGQIPASATPAR